MKIFFSPKISLVCLILALGMFRLAYWQWDRHQEKIEFIKELDQRLHMPVMPFEAVLAEVQNSLNPLDWDKLTHRRVVISGSYEFKDEIIIKNRKHEEAPGFHVITPLKIQNSDQAILVNRGFIPFSEKELGKRIKFQNQKEVTFVGLIKKSAQKKLLAPEDLDNSQTRIDEWLRIDVAKISKQIPCKILPVFLEILPSADLEETLNSIVTSSKGKDEILNLAIKGVPHAPEANTDWSIYPIPSFTTVVPAGRHFGYIFEWSIMALATLFIGLLLQMRKTR